MCNKNEKTGYSTAQQVIQYGEERRDTDIQKARIWLKNQNIPKTGYNRSLNYRYYEFDDFIGYVQRACEQFELSTHFSMDTILPGSVQRPRVKRNEADMMPTFVGIASLEVKSVHYHEPRITKVPFSFQLVHTDTGNAITYAKRYAYMVAFEISDAEVVEITHVPEKPQKQYMRKDNNQQKGGVVPQKVIAPQNNDDSWSEDEIIKSLHKKEICSTRINR